MDFEPYLELMFQRMVDYTEPICQLIGPSLSQMLTFDTSGIELYVTANNPRTLNALIRKLKVFYKSKPDADPYKMAYGLMPSQAASCPMPNRCISMAISVMLTNLPSLRTVRHISFPDDSDFRASHPELTVGKKTDFPDEDKSIGDASALIPVLTDYFPLHPDFHPDTFPGDSAFDSAGLYGKLFHDFHFSRALIPHNHRNESSLKKAGYNAYGYPTCPNGPSVSMKYCGITKEKGRSGRIKWICPKMHDHKVRICDCGNPCSSARKGRTAYTCENMDYLLSDEPFDEEKCRSLIDHRVKASKDEVMDAVHGYHILAEQKFKMTHAKAHMDFISKTHC